MALGILQYKQPPEVKQRISRTLAKRRPIFHIGTMNNPIARFASTLAQTPPGGIFLDAFCGSGGILIEAALDGCYTVGVDVDYYFIRGVRLNMRYYSPDRHLGEIRASALALPLRSRLDVLGNCVQGVSSDLPYGRSTSRRGITVTSIWDGFLAELAPLVPVGTRCCLILPDTPEVQGHLPLFAQNRDFRLIEKLDQYVHDSLTRLFLLVERVAPE
jgi:tRNA (guanine10-N2)-dimethyltransferase